MEAVPAAVALDGQKQRFDLGVFVGDLPLDDDVARSGHELDLPLFRSLSPHLCAAPKLTRCCVLLFRLAVIMSRWRG
jgi:hypothetical protein